MSLKEAYIFAFEILAVVIKAGAVLIGFINLVGLCLLGFIMSFAGMISSLTFQVCLDVRGAWGHILNQNGDENLVRGASSFFDALIRFYQFAVARYLRISFCSLCFSVAWAAGRAVQGGMI